MPINDLEFATKMTTELDKAIVAKSVTGMFADNNLREKFVGAKTVLIPNMDMSGLGDYDRDDGFVQGSISVDNESYTLTMDRGRTFHLDREDEDETGIPKLAGQVLGEFVRTKVVPEVDAYVLSKVGAYAADEEQTLALSGTAYYALFCGLENAVREVVDDEELVAFVTSDFLTGLQNDTAVSKQITVSEFTKGGVSFKVKSINDIPLIRVPKTRMFTEYTFNDGETSGQTDGGFVPTDDAQIIHCLIVPKRAISLVKKTEKLRTFAPDQNLNKDAWKLDYRIYYDAFIKNSMKTAVWAYVVDQPEPPEGGGGEGGGGAIT